MIFVVGNVKVNVDHQRDVCSLGQARAAYECLCLVETSSLRMCLILAI